MEASGRAGARSRRARAGFTIVEVMIALSVLVVTVLATTAAQLVSHDLVRQSRETSVAMSDLQTAMEQILLLPIDDIPVAGSNFQAGQPIAAFNDLHLPAERIVPAYAGFGGGAAVPDPLPITLTMTWNDPKGRSRLLRLSCMKTR